MITPDEIPEGSPSPEDFSADVETSIVVDALLANLNDLNGKNVFVNLIGGAEFIVGGLEVVDRKTVRIGHNQVEVSLDNISSIREV